MMSQYSKWCFHDIYWKLLPAMICCAGWKMTGNPDFPWLFIRVSQVGRQHEDPYQDITGWGSACLLRRRSAGHYSKCLSTSKMAEVVAWTQPFLAASWVLQAAKTRDWSPPPGLMQTKAWTFPRWTFPLDRKRHKPQGAGNAKGLRANNNTVPTAWKPWPLQQLWFQRMMVQQSSGPVNNKNKPKNVSEKHQW